MAVISSESGECMSFQVILNNDNNNNVFNNDLSDDDSKSVSTPKAKAKAKAKAKSKTKAKAKTLSKTKPNADDDLSDVSITPKPKAKAKTKVKTLSKTKPNADDDLSDELITPKPKAKAKVKTLSKTKPNADDDLSDELTTTKTKPKINNNIIINDKLIKECANDFKKIYNIIKYINKICIKNIHHDDRLDEYNRLDIVLHAKEYTISFIKDISKSLLKLMNLNNENTELYSLDINIDINNKDNYIKILNYIFIYLGSIFGDSKKSFYYIIDKHINNHLIKRNNKIYSILCDKLYFSNIKENELIFKGIIFILIHIIENDEIINSTKPSSRPKVSIAIFIKYMSQLFINNIKNHDNVNYNDDNLKLLYYFYNTISNKIFTSDLLIDCFDLLSNHDENNDDE